MMPAMKLNTPPVTSSQPPHRTVLAWGSDPPGTPRGPARLPIPPSPARPASRQAPSRVRAAATQTGRAHGPAGAENWWRPSLAHGTAAVLCRPVRPAVIYRPAAGGLSSFVGVVGEPAHQRAQLGPHLLDLLGVQGLAPLEEVRPAAVELGHEFGGERAVPDLPEDALHLFHAAAVDDPRPAGVD